MNCSSDGSIIHTETNESVSRTTEKITRAYRNNAFVVVGYKYFIVVLVFILFLSQQNKGATFNIVNIYLKQYVLF